MLLHWPTCCGLNATTSDGQFGSNDCVGYRVPCTGHSVAPISHQCSHRTTLRTSQPCRHLCAQNLRLSRLSGTSRPKIAIEPLGPILLSRKGLLIVSYHRTDKLQHLRIVFGGNLLRRLPSIKKGVAHTCVIIGNFAK
eukprot:2205618-Amphidinium_carterae.1